MKQFLLFAILCFGFYACSSIGNKEPQGKTVTDGEKNFYKVFRWNDIKIHFVGQKSKPVNLFKIWTEGLNVKNDTLIKSVNGKIYAVFMKDLNADDCPEVYVFVDGSGTTSYNEFYGFSTINNDSLEDIGFDNFLIHTLRGYSGFDTLYSENNHIIWEYPVYKSNDSYDAPSGGNRKIFFGLDSVDGKYFMKVDTVHNNLK